MSQATELYPTERVTNFGEHATWTGVHSADRAAWLELRRKLVTASDVAAIMGEDDFRCPLDVYVDKRMPRPVERLALDDPRFLGAVVEQPILQAVAEYHGWKYHRGGALLRSRKHPRIGATLDAEVERGDGVWCALEGKTTELAGSWDEETGQLPTRVLIQAQSQLLVTGAPVNIVFAWLRRWKTATIEVYPNPALHSIMVEYVERFLDLVDRETPPPPDGTEASTNALGRLYPKDNGEAVRLPPESVNWTEEIAELTAQQKELKRREVELRNLLRSSIGNATFGVLPHAVNGAECWRWQKQGESRVLRTIKRAPLVDPQQLPDAVPDRSLEESLRQSLQTPLKPKRRRNAR
jgi:predicted phage-related endonuclease